MARLKVLLDKACSAPKPALNIKCNNGGKLELLRFSYDSLIVYPGSLTDSTATVGSVCEDRADCELVYLTNDADEDRYGEVYFSCSGDYVEATAAQAYTTSTGEVECTAGFIHF